MRAAKIREAFLKYFEKHGHTRVKSSSLVPANDPTLFFTNAGMVQFKEVFTGEERRQYTRACSSQKCMRVSGKHNDLENVGHTPRHHTFFEMLGNFSFGDYFKSEAIEFAWNLLTKEYGLDKKKMIVTVFREDDEAEKLWQRFVPKERIYRLDEKDNFWTMGDTGPCGPCSEILWDFGSGPFEIADFETSRFMEIWNLVFMQFNRDASGKMEKLTSPSIDTGMGLERLAAVMQGFTSNWETDLFKPIIAEIAKVTGAEPGSSSEADEALRVIADHLRGSVFLIGDGVIPSNEGRGYVLRRILRRAIRYGKRIGRDEPFLSKLVGVIIDEMGGAYPELATHEHFIVKVVGAEEDRFYETLDKGLALLMEEASKTKDDTLSGDVAFKLYDTYGFPLDVTQIIASEQKLGVDVDGFNKLMEEQRERARASWKGSGEETVGEAYKALAGLGIQTQFVGYTKDSEETKVLAILVNGERVAEAEEGQEVEFVAKSTPFYGESGGQVGDTGVAVAEGMEVEIVDTKRPLENLIVHKGKVVRGKIKDGKKVTLAIDSDRRDRIRCNHTATHLLHRALREVLGEHVKQAGSYVAPDRMRFDFSHFQAMTPEEIKEVEKRVNRAIRKNYPVLTYELTYDEAVAHGALAFFGEKYGERVRLIDISGFSKELCGGTHVHAAGDIGMMKIVSESSVAAGVRRVEAVTGAGVEKLIRELQAQREEVARALKAPPSEIAEKAKKLAEQVSNLEKELKRAKAQKAEFKGEISEDVDGLQVVVATVEGVDRKSLGTMAEKMRAERKADVVVLGTRDEESVSITGVVTKDSDGDAHAGKIVKSLSEEFGGKGGGRPDFAQGGGKDVEKYDAFVQKAMEIAKKELRKREKKDK